MSQEFTGNGGMIWMDIVRGTLSAALLASGAAGTQILATDKWLWLATPTHTYGLIAFVAVDITLVAGMCRKTRLATVGAMVIAAVQLGAMLGDLVAGQPTGVPSNAFRSYLLGSTVFMSLLAIQGVILVLAVGTFTIPRVQGHSENVFQRK